MENTTNQAQVATGAKGLPASHAPSHAGMVATGIVSGLAVSAITATGRSLMGKVGKHPFAVLGIGLAAGYFAHKYRKEIIATVSDAAERSKHFALHQRAHIESLLAKSQEATEETGMTDNRP